jgi:tight adherence protein C
MFEQLRNQLASGEPIVIMLVAALATLTLFWGLATMLGRHLDPARRRLEEITADTQQAKTAGLGQRIERLIQPFARFLLPRGSELEGTRQKLLFAGFKSTSAMTSYYGAKLALCATLMILWLLATRFMPSLTSGRIMFVALAVGFVGMILPGMWLDRKVKARHQRLRCGFPDALDLLTVCVESGLGLSQALQRVADELEVSHPELASEIAQVTAQMRAGVERESALRGLATRTGLDDVRGLVGLLVQTLRFGTGIADALRVYSEEFRDKRTQRAEEAAAKIGTKLIFPLVLCLFPSFFVVAVGPAVIRIMEAFSGK